MIAIARFAWTPLHAVVHRARRQVSEQRGVMMALFRTQTEVLHIGLTPHGFFTGHSGYQILAEVTYLFGWRLRIRELDRETVPHWHYVQQRTLGCSEWRSRLLKQIKEKTDEGTRDNRSASDNEKQSTSGV
jgi:hypothetical protein